MYSSENVCAHHPGVGALATCARCGDYLCRPCMAEEHPPRCVRCVAVTGPSRRPAGVWIAEGTMAALALCCFGSVGVLGALAASADGPPPPMMGLVCLLSLAVLPLVVVIAAVKRTTYARSVLLVCHALSAPFLCCGTASSAVDMLGQDTAETKAFVMGQLLGLAMMMLMVAMSAGSAIYLAFSAEAKAWYSARPAAG